MEVHHDYNRPTRIPKTVQPKQSKHASDARAVGPARAERQMAWADEPFDIG